MRRGRTSTSSSSRRRAIRRTSRGSRPSRARRSHGRTGRRAPQGPSSPSWRSPPRSSSRGPSLNSRARSAERPRNGGASFPVRTQVRGADAGRSACDHHADVCGGQPLGCQVQDVGRRARHGVAVQSPAAGTRLIDTGAPTISLSLSVNQGYPQAGAPENASPFHGTAVEYADAAANRVAVPRAKPRKHAAPTRKAPKKKHAPAPRPKVRVKAKPKVKPPAKPKAKGKRPPAFVLPGSRPEPHHELPLPDRARLLATWLSGHQTPSDANVQHWLYQHTWIVAGARFGWWHGAEALETLIGVDGRVQALWGIGAKSEGIARTALAEVRANSR